MQLSQAQRFVYWQSALQFQHDQIGIWKCLFLWMRTGEPGETFLEAEQRTNKLCNSPTYDTKPDRTQFLVRGDALAAYANRASHLLNLFIVYVFRLPVGIMFFMSLELVF